MKKTNGRILCPCNDLANFHVVTLYSKLFHFVMNSGGGGRAVGNVLFVFTFLVFHFYSVFDYFDGDTFWQHILQSGRT